jgi:SlyX protein
MTDIDRFEALEIKIAHLERGLQELSDVVVRQQQDLERLSLRNQQLKEQLEDLGAAAGDKKDPYEVPPHY